MNFLSDLWDTQVAREELSIRLWVAHPWIMGSFLLCVIAMYIVVWRLK